MPALKTYHLFISHAWKYGDQYERLIRLLDHAPRFIYRDHSAPEDDPLIPAGKAVSNRRITKAIERRIEPVHCVLVLSGMYVAHREWMQKEIDIAIAYEKPIIGVIPRGRQRLPRIVTDFACPVRWNTDSIVSAIRKSAVSG